MHTEPIQQPAKVIRSTKSFPSPPDQRSMSRGGTKQQGRGTHALLAVGVDEPDGEVDGLDDEPDAVDGDDEDAVGVDDGDAVEHPQRAVEQRRQVGVRLELLHVPGLEDPPERRPVQAPEHKRRRRRRLSSVSTQYKQNLLVY